MDKVTDKKPAPKKKTATAKASATDKKPRAPGAKKVDEPETVSVVETQEETTQAKSPATVVEIQKPIIADGRYVFATGRRKSAIANIRLFSGKGSILVNKKPVGTYFFNRLLQETATRQFHVTGLANDFYFTVSV